jgi:hypothetical protein
MWDRSQCQWPFRSWGLGIQRSVKLPVAPDEENHRLKSADLMRPGVGGVDVHANVDVEDRRARLTLHAIRLPKRQTGPGILWIELVNPVERTDRLVKLVLCQIDVPEILERIGRLWGKDRRLLEVHNRPVPASPFDVERAANHMQFRRTRVQLDRLVVIYLGLTEFAIALMTERSVPVPPRILWVQADLPIWTFSSILASAASASTCWISRLSPRVSGG